MSNQTYYYYYIFKTNHRTGKTELVCCGSHNTEGEISLHWRSYMYGYMDALREQSGVVMTQGSSVQSFRVSTADEQKDLEYFMLLNDEGSELVMEITNNQ